MPDKSCLTSHYRTQPNADGHNLSVQFLPYRAIRHKADLTRMHRSYPAGQNLANQHHDLLNPSGLASLFRTKPSVLDPTCRTLHNRSKRGANEPNKSCNATPFQTEYNFTARYKTLPAVPCDSFPERTLPHLPCETVPNRTPHFFT